MLGLLGGTAIALSGWGLGLWAAGRTNWHDAQLVAMSGVGLLTAKTWMAVGDAPQRSQWTLER